MTISDVLAQVDGRKHNTYSQSEKIAWLSQLDAMVKKEIVDGHEGAQSCSFSGYREDEPLHTVLLVPEPYDEMYLRFLEAQMDYHNGEYHSYNNAINQFNSIFEHYRAYYTRNHSPLPLGAFRL